MEKVIRNCSLGIILLFLIIYLLLNALGLRAIITIEKIMIIIGIIVAIVNIGLYILKVIKENKILKTIISFQIFLVAIFMCCILLKNFNTNMYLVNKNGNNFMMKVNVNDNSKEYYLCKNNYMIYKDCAIKEYLKDTTLSYEENTLVKVEYNKNILEDCINKEVIETQKKIISSKAIENTSERINLNIDNSEELTKFCDKYDLDNLYDSSYFENNSLLVISYIPFREVIPYIAVGEDNNLYVYIKENNDNDFNTNSFCFIEYSKIENVKKIIIEDYDNVMKNNQIK